MSDHVTVTLPRAEFDAVLAVVTTAGTARPDGGEHGGPSLTMQDLRAALRKLERASCGLSVVP